MRISDWSSDVCSSDLRYAGGDHCQSGSDFRRVFSDAAGDSAWLHAAPAHFPHQRLDRRADIHSPYQLGPDGDGHPAGAEFPGFVQLDFGLWHRSEEHTSELQSLMRTSYAVFCLKKKKKTHSKKK